MATAFWDLSNPELSCGFLLPMLLSKVEMVFAHAGDMVWGRLTREPCHAIIGIFFEQLAVTLWDITGWCTALGKSYKEACLHKFQFYYSVLPSIAHCPQIINTL